MSTEMMFHVLWKGFTK